MPDRRHLLRAAALAAPAALVGTAALVGAPPAAARAPLGGAAIPAAHRFALGECEVTALSDGSLDLTYAEFPALDAPSADALLDAAFLPRGAVRLGVNAFAYNSGDRLVLIDAGTGPGIDARLGEVPRALAAAGIDPASVDAVLLTHLHYDHARGLLDANGGALFPNAEVVVAAAEHAFWFDDGAMGRAGPGAAPFFAHARAALRPYAPRLRLIAGAGEVLPGITALPTPGHTPGHTAYRLSSAGRDLLVWGDLLHAAPLQMARPEWGLVFDVDAAASLASRRRVLDLAATDRLMIAGAHLPFPGVGHVARAGAGYAYVPKG